MDFSPVVEFLKSFVLYIIPVLVLTITYLMYKLMKKDTIINTRRLKYIKGGEIGEKFIPNIIKKAKAGDEIYFVVKTATFPPQVNQEIYTALNNGAKIKMLIPLMPDSENQIRNFISHKNIQIHNFDPGRVRLLMMGDEALISISDPDSHEYSGVYIHEDTFSRFLKISIEKIFTDAPPINLIGRQI